LSFGQSLTIILGNHDIELSLPSVRTWLFNRLEGNGRRIKFIYDGEAYVRGDLLIEHGNRYDRLNATNHSALRQERSVLSRRVPAELEFRNEYDRFQAPAGSLLVIDVINPLKRQFKFIDVLKPESEAVVPLLLALYPEATNLLRAAFKLSGAWARSNIANRSRLQGLQAGYLGASQEYDFTLEQLLRDNLTQVELQSIALPSSSDGALSGVTEKNGYIIAKKFLTGVKLCFSRFTKDNRNIKTCLRKLQNNDTFDINKEIPQYLDEAKALVSHGGFKTIVFGHTHLPKQVTFKCDEEDKSYINTGTWADIIKIPISAFVDNADGDIELERFIDAMRAGEYSNYICRYLSYAKIEMDENKVCSSKLQCFAGVLNPEEQPFTPAPVTQ
jgi:UDP-2,3-diacylglucosamine pyrophosphatase LpxH